MGFRWPLVDEIIISVVSLTPPLFDPNRTYIEKERSGEVKQIPVERELFEARFEKAIVNPTVVSQTSGIPLSNFPVPTQPLQPNAQPIEKTDDRQKRPPEEHRSPTRNGVPHIPVFLRMPRELNARGNENRNNRRPRDALARA
ncbi:MAG: hypothetical protein AABW86_04880 [Candidatus Micrarchaeota archaeon]